MQYFYLGVLKLNSIDPVHVFIAEYINFNMLARFKKFLNTVRLNRTLQQFTDTGVHLRYIGGIAFGQLEKYRSYRTVEMNIVLIFIREFIA